MAFYAPHVRDPHSGFHQNFYDDGQVFSTESKHLVSSCRMVVNYCLAERLFGGNQYRSLWQHGLEAIRSVHWQPEHNGYVWTLDATGPTDQTHYCYGLAFTLLAFSAAYLQGDQQAKSELYRTWHCLEDNFWQPDIGLYADQISLDWKTTDPYRGQNANMHCCEALILAFEATQDPQFLARALQLAETVSVTLADRAGGFIWEHFHDDLSIDWDYNRDDPKNLYRPWGFQPGHQTEWAKLLLQLYDHCEKPWLLDRARTLFDHTLPLAWDSVNGGLIYGFGLDHQLCDGDKYFWVQAETLAAAGLLAKATGAQVYWDWYDRIWDYCWSHFVDHRHGAWFRLLTQDNQKTSNRKSEAGAKCDYHTIGACYLLHGHLSG